MPETGENWICPYCNHAQVIDSARSERTKRAIYVDGCEWGDLGYWYQAIACANSKCRKLSFDLALLQREDRTNGFAVIGMLREWRLLPASFAKPQPDYIPQAIRDDYGEACAIRDLSPKASATIARRCIKGMIRDFCGIARARLVDEINDLTKQVEQGKAPPGVLADSVEAIDHVRRIGNIGAHMEKDINVIVDVDPDEAQKLIELIELLFEEWYVARNTRAEKLRQLGIIAASKKVQQATKPQS